jgi:hypothetical protein
MEYYVIEYHAKPKGESGESCKSTYNLESACKNCGTGARLVGSLITKGLTKVTTDFFQTLDWDFLISEDLYKFLLSKGVQVGNLKKIVDSGKNILPFYHLYTELSFPKSLPSSEGLVTERQCPVCKSNGYFADAKIGDAAKGIPTVITPLRLKYEGITREFLVSSELFNTWEHLGLSNLKAEGTKVTRYARPMLIVNEKIKLAFEEYGVKKAVFEEVSID